jgi:predicted phosphodiesterase
MSKPAGWKKWMAVACSHGEYLDPEAREAVLAFKERWKPHTTLHLGDFIDLAAMRSGAMSNPSSTDRARNVAHDVHEGVQFLQELRPQHVLFGNHEARLYGLRESPNALAAHAAQTVLQDIDDVAKKLKARVYEYNIRSYAQLGDTKFLHGYMYNVQAVRDHAEAFGSRIVMGHIHRCGQERARTLNGVSGYAIGMLARFDMEYAATRRATLGWSQGFGWGEYNDQFCTVNVCERTFGQPWRLPI